MSRSFRRSAAALAAVGLAVLTGCSSSAGKETLAPNVAPPRAVVAPIGLAPVTSTTTTTTTTTTVAPTTVAPTTLAPITVPEPTFPLAPPPTLPPVAVVAQAPAPTAAPVPRTAPPTAPKPQPVKTAPPKTAPAQTAPPKPVVPVATKPPATAPEATPPPPTALPATIPATTPPTVPVTTPPTTPPTTPTIAPTTALTPTTVKAPAASKLKVNTPCPKAKVGLAAAATDGSPIVCSKVKTLYKWTSVTPSSIAAPALATATSTPVNVPGFDGKTIKLGVLTTTTHPVWGQIGKALLAGTQARVAAINRRGGISGKYKIELVIADTNYDPQATISQYNALKDRVAGFVTILGTPATEAMEPILRADGALASPASQEARWASAPNLLPVFNSYQVQAINGIAYFLESVAPAKPVVCSVSVGTSFGDAGTEGFKFAVDRLGATAGPALTIGATDNNVAPFIGQLRAANCGAVMVTVGPATTLQLVVGGRQAGFSPRWIIMGASFSDKIVIPQTSPIFETSAWVVGDGTQWGDSNVPGMTKMISELIASDNRYWTENPDVGLTYGYTQGIIWEAVLEKAATRGDFSKAGLLSASTQIGTVDTFGLGSPVDYSQPSRLANARTTIFAVDGSYRNAIKVLAPSYASPAAQAYKK
jgi:ABC-type branched-subunit amino acid transport system substrate-binding protein